MPIYIYKNEATGEVKEVIQRMTEEHVYEENGIQWKRIFTVPQASMDTNVDVFSQKDFLKKTEGSGTIGDLWDRSAEWSEKRASKIGAPDPIKRKEFDNFSKTRKGKKHEKDV